MGRRWVLSWRLEHLGQRGEVRRYFSQEGSAARRRYLEAPPSEGVTLVVGDWGQREVVS